MSSYVTVPDSNVKLKDGTVVMLQRFPGTKWIVHNGWYSYNGKNYEGWYFSSVPAQTILPLNQYDLQGITVVASGDDSPAPRPPRPVPVPPAPPEPPVPPYPFPPFPNPEYPIHPGPNPGPWPHPYPDDKFGPNPYPPMPPVPGPDKPAFFGQSQLKMLNSAFITVEKVKDFEELNTEDMPDGRMVCINSENGVRKYYRWNERDDRWDEIDPQAIIDARIESAFEGYPTAEGLEEKFDSIDSQIVDVADSIEELEAELTGTIAQLSQKETADMQSVTQEIARIDETISTLRNVISEQSADIGEEISGLADRIDEIEDAIFNVKKLAELLGTNTVLVSDAGGIADSGVSIGDDVIGEISEYADAKTVATEKAVADLVERSQTKWTSF